MWAEFLTVSGWLFWAVVVAVALLIALFDSAEGGEHAALTTGVFALVGVVLFTNVFAGVTLVAFALFAAGYFAVGPAWAFWKWYRFLIDRRDYTKKVYANHQAGGEHMRIKETLEEHLKKNQPTAANNKARIVAWILLWPFSVLGSLLSWPRRLVVWIFNLLRGVFDRIADKIFSG